MLELKAANPSKPWKEIGAELEKPHWACKARYKQLIAGNGAQKHQQEETRRGETGEADDESELENTEAWTKDQVGLLKSALMFLWKEGS